MRGIVVPHEIHADRVRITLQWIQSLVLCSVRKKGTLGEEGGVCRSWNILRGFSAFSRGGIFANSFLRWIRGCVVLPWDSPMNLSWKKGNACLFLFFPRIAYRELLLYVPDICLGCIPHTWGARLKELLARGSENRK